MNSMNQEENLKLLQKKLFKHLDDQKKEWKSFVYAKELKFYQGYDRIGIDGGRPTEERLKRYDIQKYLAKDKTALDIGSNCGFFTIHVAQFLKHIDGAEINPYIVDIGKDTAQFLNVNNVSFFASSFEDFIADERYDIIFSLANDETIDENTQFTFEEYMNKIMDILKKDGLVIFESHATDAHDKVTFEPKRKFLEEHFDVIEDRLVQSNYPYNVKKRMFLVLKKKQGADT